MFYLDCSLHWLVGDFQEFCQTASQSIFQLFNHVIILSVIDTFRLPSLLEWCLNQQVAFNFVLLYFMRRDFAGGTFYGTS